MCLHIDAAIAIGMGTRSSYRYIVSTCGSGYSLCISLSPFSLAYSQKAIFSTSLPSIKQGKKKKTPRKWWPKLPSVFIKISPSWYHDPSFNGHHASTPLYKENSIWSRQLAPLPLFLPSLKPTPCVHCPTATALVKDTTAVNPVVDTHIHVPPVPRAVPGIGQCLVNVCGMNSQLI